MNAKTLSPENMMKVYFAVSAFKIQGVVSDSIAAQKLFVYTLDQPGYLFLVSLFGSLPPQQHSSRSRDAIAGTLQPSRRTEWAPFQANSRQ